MTQVDTISRSEADSDSESGAPTSGELLVRRIRMLSAMAVAGAIFWYFGWWVARPVDPSGPVALLMLEQSVISMAELLGLAVVVSGLAVAICGVGSAERGPLAVAVGLATLGARGVQMDQLVLHRLTAPAGHPMSQSPFPVWGLIAETWLWLALVGVGFVVGRWVESWFGSLPSDAERRGAPEANASDARQGIGSVVVACLIAWTIIYFFAGSSEMPILKGQVYFALFAGFLAASLVAHWFLQTTTRVWMLVSVAIVATAAYVWGAPDAEAIREAAKAGTYVTLDPVARPLPIEYAAVGAIGVLFEADAMGMLCAMFGLSPGEREATSSSGDRS